VACWQGRSRHRQFTALAADFRDGASLDHITDLVDVRMAVGKRAMRLADDAEQHLEVFRSGFLWSDQAAIDCSGVIERRIGRDFAFLHKELEWLRHVALL